MKNIIKIAALLLSLTPVLLTSCNKDEVVTATITSVSPAEAYPRNTITVSGTNLDQVQFVFLGKNGVEFELQDGKIVFDVPQNQVDGDHDITLALAGNVRAKGKLKVLPSADPIFVTWSKKAAKVGESVTIEGGSLANVESVTIGGVEAQVTANTANSVTFTVPAGVPDKRGKVKVVTAAGEREAEFTFYVAKEILVTDFDGNGLGTWGGIGGAVDTEKSGVKSSNPNPYSGNFFKMVMSSGGWGGSQIEVPAGFGLTASRDDVMLVAEVNTNGTTPDYRFNVATAGDAKFWSNYRGATTGWQTIEMPLKDFGWRWDGNPATQNVDGQAIIPSELRIVKVQWGGNIVAGNEVNFDNIRFIEF